MTVLLLLSNADGICLIDAITTGGIAVLKKLYEFNRSDCESAIIQMIKYKISCIPALYSTHLFSCLTPPSLHHASSHRRSQRTDQTRKTQRANRADRAERPTRRSPPFLGDLQRTCFPRFIHSKLGLLWILQGSDLSKISCEQLPLPREQVRAFPCLHSRFHAASSFATPPFSST